MAKKGKRRHYSRHHRQCRSNNGTNDDSNISIVDQKRHRLWHSLFENLKPEEIFREINEIWLPPDYEIILVRRNNENRKSSLPRSLSGLLPTSPFQRVG